jgi:hypothetical protein
MKRVVSYPVSLRIDISLNSIRIEYKGLVRRAGFLFSKGAGAMLDFIAGNS